MRESSNHFLPLKRLEQMANKGYMLMPLDIIQNTFRNLVGDKGRLLIPFLIFLGLGQLLSTFGYITNILLNVLVDPFIVAYVYFVLFNRKFNLPYSFIDLLKRRWKQLIGMNLLYYLNLLLAASPFIFTMWNYNILDKINSEDFVMEEAMQAIPEQLSLFLTLDIMFVLFLVVAFWWSTILVLFFDIKPIQSIHYSVRLVWKRFGRQLNIAMFIGLIFFLSQSLIISFAGLGETAMTIISLICFGYLNVYIYTSIFETFCQAFFFVPLSDLKDSNEEKPRANEEDFI